MTPISGNGFMKKKIIIINLTSRKVTERKISTGLLVCSGPHIQTATARLVTSGGISVPVTVANDS